MDGKPESGYISLAGISVNPFQILPAGTAFRDLQLAQEGKTNTKSLFPGSPMRSRGRRDRRLGIHRLSSRKPSSHSTRSSSASGLKEETRPPSEFIEAEHGLKNRGKESWEFHVRVGEAGARRVQQSQPSELRSERKPREPPGPGLEKLAAHPLPEFRNSEQNLGPERAHKSPATPGTEERAPPGRPGSRSHPSYSPPRGQHWSLGKGNRELRRPRSAELATRPRSGPRGPARALT